VTSLPSPSPPGEPRPSGSDWSAEVKTTQDRVCPVCDLVVRVETKSATCPRCDTNLDAADGVA
jgi:uncharacterized paraquat-inducible protein A